MTLLLDRIRQCLTRAGTAAHEIAEELDMPLSRVKPRMQELRLRGQAHICAWRRDEVGGRLYPRALWAPGPAPAKLVVERVGPLSRAEQQRRYAQRCQGCVTSVFALGVPSRRRGVPVPWGQRRGA